MHIYIIHDLGHPVLMEAMERQLQVFLDENKVSGTARWYYDEFAKDGTEYGVRLDVQGLSSDEWPQFVEEAFRYCVSLHGDYIRAEVA